jgi:hypothetical protein
MGVSCIVDSIAGKMGIIGEQNVTNHMGVRINPTTQFEPATYVRSFKILNALYVIFTSTFCKTNCQYFQRVTNMTLNVLPA